MRLLITLLILLNCSVFAKPVKPNFMFILADDCTFRDLEVYGGQAKTPHLNALAASAFHAGATYRYRAWVRSTSGAKTVNVHCALDAATSISEPWGITSDWKLIEYSFRLPSEETISSIRLWVEGGASSTFDLDDVSVVLMSAPAVMSEPMNSEATPVSMWNSWIAEYPGLGGSTNFADHADSDRFDNLTEYAWGGDPSDGEDVAPPPPPPPCSRR